MSVRGGYALLLASLLTLPLGARADDDAPAPVPPAPGAHARKPDSKPKTRKPKTKESQAWKHLTLKDLAPSYADLYKPAPAEPDMLSQSQLDKLYDNKPQETSDGVPVPAYPQNLRPDFVISNGQIQSASLTYKPSGTTLEMGVLGGPDAPNALIAPSPYLNLKQTWDDKPTSWIDYHIALQAAVVQMYARYFNDESSADPQTLALANQIQDLPPGFGPGVSPNVPSLMSYNDGYQETNLVLTSALAQFGRAYTLFGPVDLGWTAGALLKTSQIFPNAAGDLTAGPRVDLGDGRSVMVSGGVTQNVSPVGNDLIQQYLAGGQPGLGIFTEAAPHTEVTYRGSIPGEEQLKLDATAMRQWNQSTILDQMRASLSTDVGGRPTELGYTWKNENGPAIEYSRQTQRMDVTRHFSNSVAGTVGYQSDNITYGNATLSNGAWTAGVKIDLDKSAGGGSAEIKENFNPQYTQTNPPSGAFSQFTGQLDQAVSQVLNIAEQGEASLQLPVSPNAGNPNDDPQRMQAIASTISNLTPAQQAAYKLALLQAASGNPSEQQSINQLFTGNNLQLAAAGLNQGAGVMALLGNEQVLENFVDILLRNRMVNYFDTVSFQVPIINMDLHWSPAVMIAAAQVLSNRPSPMKPMTAGDETTTLQPWMQSQLAVGAGLPANATPQQIAAALLQTAPPALQAQLQASGAQTVTALVDALSDEIRLQFNEMMIQVILAGEQLNRLNVDHGRQLGDLNDSMLDTEFTKLHARQDRAAGRAERAHQILEGAIARLKAESR